MRIKNYIALFVAFFSINAVFSQAKKYKINTVAFYNCENFFDTINDPNTNDEDFTPERGWSSAKYKQKIENLGLVLSQIGIGDKQSEPPTIIGVSEIENRGVLEDLIKNHQMIDKDYGIVHFESPDKRGIDVGFLYRKKYFKPTSFINVPLLIYKDEEADKPKKGEKAEVEEITTDKAVVDKTTNRIYTRDQLLVTGLLDGEEINVIVDHWPSRLGGEKKSSRLREAAGALTRRIMDSLYRINPKAKIIVLGDLNDGTLNRSVKVALGAKGKKSELAKPSDIYNPFEEMAKKGNATLFYRDAGDIFDHIMLTEPFINGDYSTFHYWFAGIYNKPFMIQTTGQYKGYPLRHSANEVGFSDHFPVYVYLIKELK